MNLIKYRSEGILVSRQPIIKILLTQRLYFFKHMNFSLEIENSPRTNNCPCYLASNSSTPYPTCLSLQGQVFLQSSHQHLPSLSPSLSHSHSHSHSPSQQESLSSSYSKTALIKKADKSKKREGCQGMKREGSCGRRKEGSWSDEQVLQYFYATLSFAVQNHFHTISWDHWKPNSFYNHVSQHLTKTLGKTQSKDKRQCRTKDQNLRLKFFRNSQGQNLIEAAYHQIKEWVTHNSNSASGGVNKERILRFRNILGEINKLDLSCFKKNEYCDALSLSIEQSKDAISWLDSVQFSHCL